MVVFADQEEEKRIEFLRKREEEEAVQILSQKYGVEYVDLSLVAINTDALRLISKEDSQTAEIAAFGRVGKRLSVAVRSPENSKAKIVIEQLKDLGYQVTVFMTSQESLKRAYDRYADLSYATESKAGVFEISPEEVEELLTKVNNLEDIGRLISDVITLKQTYRVTRILEIILAGGLATEASDIHMEPEETSVRLRYRLDGVLVDILSFDQDSYRLILSRLKLLSGLKLNITKEAQDGRFSIKIKGEEIELRTSVLPNNYSETLVLRILNPKSIAISFNNLGMNSRVQTEVEKQINKPNGMILNTGPTGSGKTTTLYAFLSTINKPGTKIITIEDPIEYHLQGIVQTQVDKKNYTFAEGLRSILRQDPDIIMVGEIRDNDVASTAINAALTGHLVFSTLHTNDAAGSFPRLIDLNVSEKVLSSSINLAMAQRLVRKLCSACKKERPVTPEEKATIDRILGGIVDRSLVPAAVTTVWDASPEGCPSCRGRGYKGRIGVFEAIYMGRAIEEILRTKPSEREVASAAKSQGIPTMVEDGVIKVAGGITSLEELRRVVDIDATV